MMASVPQNFNPAMAGMGPGGQPMVHPQANQGMPGAGQPGVSMAQQIHPGMAGPGMPQVSQGGPMMGMMPGGGPPGVPVGHPNAHAMQHLTPGQGQMFPGQQMTAATAEMQARRRQDLMVQQQRAVIAQQNGGMVNNQMGGQMFAGNPTGMPNIPHHLQHPQQQQAQGAALQQQQQQQQQQQHQQNQIRLQQHQQQEQQREAARIQQAQAQARAQAQQAHQAQIQAQAQDQQQQQSQQPQAQQPLSQQQPTPQQRAAMGNMQQGLTQGQPMQGLQATQQQPQQPQQAPPQTPQLPQSGAETQGSIAAPDQSQQQGQNQPNAPANQQRPGQQNQPAQAGAQQNNAQAQAQRQAQQQQQQGGAPQAANGAQQPQPGQPPNAQQQMQMRAQQHALQQQRAAAQAQMMAGRWQQPRPHCSSLLRAFGDFISTAGEQNRGKDLVYWQNCVGRWFSDEGTLRLTYTSNRTQELKMWELACPSIARFFVKHFLSGVKHMQLHFENPQQRNLNDGSRQMECQKASLVTTFEVGSQVTASGSLKASISADDQFDAMEIILTEWVEYIPRLHLKETAIDPTDTKQSPNLSKSASKRAAQQQRQQAQAAKPTQTAPIPETVVNEFGVTKGVQQYCEFVDTMSHLTEVFKVAHARGGSFPARHALQICSSEPQPQPNPQHMNQLAFQQNANAQFGGAAGMGMHPQMAAQLQAPQMAGGGVAPPHNFLSPAQANHANLPGTQTASPATLSNHNTPAMPNMNLANVAGGQPMPSSMGAPVMAHQQSHQGTNPSAAGTPSGAMVSANASPNVGAGGKRRRPSGVDDGDINGAMVNGTGGGGAGNAKVKGTPKLGKKARPNG